MALIDSAGSMCAFGDVGHAYNNLPLAVTNLEGTDDMASADQFGWILPYSMTRNGEHSRTAAVRALRECINFAVEERELQPLGSTFGVGVGVDIFMRCSFRLYRSVVGNCVACAPKQRAVHAARAVRGLVVRGGQEGRQNQLDCAR